MIELLVICTKCYNTKSSELNLMYIHWTWTGDFDLTHSIMFWLPNLFIYTILLRGLV